MRVIKTILVPLGLAVGVHAAQFQVGGGTNGQDGLTAAYIGSGANGWQERSYTYSLFEGASNIDQTTGINANRLPTQSGATQFNTAQTTWTDPNNNGGASFNLVHDGSMAFGNMYVANDIWANVGTTNVFTIPVNVSGVDKVWILMNDFWGFAGNAPTVTFNFSDGSKDAILLGDSANGPVRSALDCTSAQSGGNCAATTQSSTPAANAKVIAAGPALTTPGMYTSGDATITTTTIWSASYSGTTVASTNPYENTSGTAVLDDLGFNFGTAHSNQTLTSISFSPSPLSGTAVSRLGISAVTVDGVASTNVAATPEPATLLTFGFGATLLGVFRLRRKQ